MTQNLQNEVLSNNQRLINWGFRGAENGQKTGMKMIGGVVSLFIISIS